jgi:hypothetical protein
MIEQYRIDFEAALKDYIAAKKIKVGHIEFQQYPRLVKPNNMVPMYISYNGFKQTSHYFEFGKIPEFSFLSGLSISTLTIPIPSKSSNLLQIMEEMKPLNMQYRLYSSMDHDYGLGLFAPNQEFVSEFAKEYGFKEIKFLGNYTQLYFDSMDDLKMTMFHMLLGKARIDFILRRIQND